MFDELCETLCEEVHRMQQKKDGLTANDLETLYKLTATIRNLDKIEDERGTDYSGASRHYVRGHYSRAGERNRTVGYARSGDLVGQLETMYDDARTEREREAIARCLDMCERR